MVSELDKWFPRGVPKDDGRPVLLCFPFAGAGASAYRSLAKELDDSIQLCPIELAGRETRFRERRAVDVVALADQLIEVLDPLLELPLVLFGRSVGGLVCAELSQRMHDWGMPPDGLILSACGDADRQIRRVDITNLDEAAFLSAVQSWGGLPDAIVESKELREISCRFYAMTFASISRSVPRPTRSRSRSSRSAAHAILPRRRVQCRGGPKRPLRDAPITSWPTRITFTSRATRLNSRSSSSTKSDRSPPRSLRHHAEHKDLSRSNRRS